MLLMLEAVMRKRDGNFLPSSKNIFNPVGLADKRGGELNKDANICVYPCVHLYQKI